MLFPISDDNTDRHRTPFVNYTLIVINILVFVFLQGMGGDTAFTFGYSTIPAEILSGQDIVTQPKIITDSLGNSFEMPGLQPTEIPVWFTLITSMFMHGGLAHIAGNMLYLWIFGDNLENVMGHAKYLFFYLLCGVIASLAHVFTTSFLGHNLYIPSLGASGAISGVLGGYMLLFPRRRVHSWSFIGMISLPAWVAVGIWIVFQVINGLGALGGQEAGGVAYAAHIGGFVAGLVLVKFFVDRSANSRTGIA